MKYLTRSLKGTYGYIKKQSIFEIFKTIILFAMALGIFFIAYYTLGTKRSLWSVIAVLGLLPASKSLVETIMFLRYKSIPFDLYTLIDSISTGLEVLYENIITTSSKSFFIPAIVYWKGSLCVLYLGNKNDVKLIEAHLNDVLKKGGYKDIIVKVFDDIDAFKVRVNNIQSHITNENITPNVNSVYTTLKAVSL